MAFSIAMTMVATVLSPLLTPMLVDRLGGAFLEIPFWPMMQTIFMIVVAPLFLGMLLRPRLGSYGARAEVVAPGIAAIAIIIICSYAVAANQERIAEISIWLALLVVMLNGLGYLFGWSAAVLFNFDQRYKITWRLRSACRTQGWAWLWH